MMSQYGKCFYLIFNMILSRLNFPTIDNIYVFGNKISFISRLGSLYKDHQQAGLAANLRSDTTSFDLFISGKRYEIDLKS